MQVAIAIILTTLLCCGSTVGMSLEAVDSFHQPDTFTYGKYDEFEYGNALTLDGSYSFFYSIPGHSSRAEERSESGEVEGAYSFVAPEGDEFHFRYSAGEDGYRVESPALPVPPEDTKEVKKAKEEFFEAYQKALELAGDYEYKYEESDEDSDEDDESSEEDSEEESEEESEEDSDEDSDESDEESDEDEDSDEDSSEESDEDSSEEGKDNKDLNDSVKNLYNEIKSKSTDINSRVIDLLEDSENDNDNISRRKPYRRRYLHNRFSSSLRKAGRPIYLRVFKK